MTVYQLARALRERRRFVAVAGATVLLAALLVAFTFQDGALRWRSGQKFEAGVQILVVSAGNDSLSNAETRQERFSAAVTYSRILRTSEAIAWVGNRNGFEPVEAIVATVEPGSALISASVIAFSPEQAQEAALSIFDYLVLKLEEPLNVAELGPTPEAPVVQLSGPFASRLTINVDQSLDAVDSDLFLAIVPDSGSGVNLVGSGFAGESVSVETTLAPVMSVVVTLQNAGGQQLDQLRLAPESVAGFVTNYPALILDIGANAVRETEPEEGEPASWELNGAAFATSWEPGAPVSTSDAAGLVRVDVGLITVNPFAEPIGGRSGPIVLAAFLILGLVLIVTMVIVMETWSQHAALQPPTPEVGSYSAESMSVEAAEFDDMLEGPIGPFSRLNLWEARGVEGDES